jgi:hypothetical protein
LVLLYDLFRLCHIDKELSMLVRLAPISAGKLDFLLEEALTAKAQGNLQDL